jgi:hypothetical protein
MGESVMQSEGHEEMGEGWAYHVFTARHQFLVDNFAGKVFAGL